MGWYSDQACTQAVSFPMRTSENVNYYGKYVACDQSIQVNYYLKGDHNSGCAVQDPFRLHEGSDGCAEPHFH